ncbi:hypothetical protein HDU90_000728 [Geranomyces variabilis]|nr:hypothetical protein HDU90_000728 [Geranomyces variabilis]
MSTGPNVTTCAAARSASLEPTSTPTPAANTVRARPDKGATSSRNPVPEVRSDDARDRDELHDVDRRVRGHDGRGATIDDLMAMLAEQHRSSERNINRLLLEVSRGNSQTRELATQVSALVDSNPLIASMDAISNELAALRGDILDLRGDLLAGVERSVPGEAPIEDLPPERAVPETPVRIARHREATPHLRRNTDLLPRTADDDAASVVSSNESSRGVDPRHLPKFGGNSVDEYEQWAKRLRVYKGVNDYSDLALKRAIPLLFKDKSPAYYWFDTLDSETVGELTFEGWMQLIKDEFADPEEGSRALGLYADCTPRSGKFKTFVEFIDEKLALRSRAYGASAAHDMPVRTTIQTIISHLPPEVRSLAQITDFKSFTDLRKWAKMYFSSPRSQELDPCVSRKRQHDHQNDKGKGSHKSNSTNSTTKAVETNDAKSSLNKVLPDGNKKPPGPCKHCKGTHWSIYCWGFDGRMDPPAGRSGPYGRAKPTDRKGGKAYVAEADDDDDESPTSFGYLVSQGFGPIVHFQ